MVIVFLDGVDATGKTTLLRHLTRHPHLRRQVHVAPPLWHYLPSIPHPETFATWVTTTPPADVATELLRGQRQRLDALRAASIDATVVVLVDRGPRTVEASAHAHLHSGVPATTGSALAPDRAAMRTAATELAAAQPCLSVELTVEDYDPIIDRLSDHDRRNPAYLHYLRTFLHRFHRTEHLDGLRRLQLHAVAPTQDNADAAASAICG